MDQYVGVTSEARKWLEDNCCKVPGLLCPHCGGTVTENLKTTEYGAYTGMFEAEYSLSEYTTKDGHAVREIIQAQPWSDGPVFFICLEYWNDHGAHKEMIELEKRVQTLSAEREAISPEYGYNKQLTEKEKERYAEINVELIKSRCKMEELVSTNTTRMFMWSDEDINNA
jgi:hypothetical protein